MILGNDELNRMFENRTLPAICTYVFSPHIIHIFLWIMWTYCFFNTLFYFLWSFYIFMLNAGAMWACGPRVKFLVCFILPSKADSSLSAEFNFLYDDRTRRVPGSRPRRIQLPNPAGQSEGQRRPEGGDGKPDLWYSWARHEGQRLWGKPLSPPPPHVVQERRFVYFFCHWPALSCPVFGCFACHVCWALLCSSCWGYMFSSMMIIGCCCDRWSLPCLLASMHQTSPCKRRHVDAMCPVDSKKNQTRQFHTEVIRCC